MASRPTLPLSKIMLMLSLVALAAVIFFDDKDDEGPIYEERIWQGPEPVPVEKAYDYQVALKKRGYKQCLLDGSSSKSTCRDLYDPDNVDRLRAELDARKAIEQKKCEQLYQNSSSLKVDFCVLENTRNSKEWQTWAEEDPKKAEASYEAWKAVITPVD